MSLSLPGLLRLLARSLEASSLVFLFASLWVMVLMLSLTLSLLDSYYGLYDSIIRPPGFEDWVAVSGPSISPLTSVIDRGALEGSLKGGQATYIVLAPGILGDRIVSVRWVGPAGGPAQGWEPSCGYCALLGRGIALEEGLEAGDWITVYSALRGYPLILKVEGVYEAGGPMDWEVLVAEDPSLEARGIGPGKASLALLRAPGPVGPGQAPGGRGLLEAALVILYSQGRGEGFAEAYERASEYYMARVGVPREAFSAASMGVVIALSLGSFIVGARFYHSNSGAIRLLWEQGVPLRAVKASMTLIALAAAASAAAFSWAALRLAPNPAPVELLGYPVALDPGFWEPAISGAVVSFVSSLGILFSRLGGEPPSSPDTA